MIAECCALCDVTRDIMRARPFIEALCQKLDAPSLVFEDNQGCIDIAKIGWNPPVEISITNIRYRTWQYSQRIADDNTSELIMILRSHTRN